MVKLFNRASFKAIIVLSLMVAAQAVADTECYYDAMCPTGQQCVWHGPNDSSCEGSLTQLNCKNCTNGACTRPSASVDADNDTIPDRLEYDLARRFFPDFMMREHEQDTGVFYGTIHDGDIHTMPYRIRPISANEVSRSAVCAIFDNCYEIRYALPFDYDFGDGGLGINFDSHEGDSEFMAFIVYSEEPFSTAINNANLWKIGLARVNHHTSHSIKTYAGSSFFNYYPYISFTWGINPPITVWSAEKKHATYFSKSECNNGGVNIPFLGAQDDCSENDFNARDSILNNARLQNIGEPNAIIDSTIHEPNFRSYSYCASYDVYGFEQFAESTAMRTKFTEDLNW